MIQCNNLKVPLCSVIALILLSLATVFAQAPAQDFRFDGSISRPVLQNYLSRAIHMGRLGEGVGNTDDNLRMVKAIGAKYLGRVIVIYSKESTVPRRLITTRDIGARIHAADPDIILEGGVYEYVSTDVNTLPIPAYVFQEFNLPVEKRNFRHRDMVFAQNPIRKSNPYTVPDITKMETRLWFYYLATSQIDAGIESIHWGWFEPQAVNDKAGGYANYYDMLARVRLYAKQHARRHFILNNADAYGGVVVDGKLLFDFHSGNLHAHGIKETIDRPQECTLTRRFPSAGGVTPSGWSCERLPYLTHIDNTGYSGKGGQPGLGGSWSWGYDEISWFANQPEAYRNQWLRYAYEYIRDCYPDSAGHLEMPGIRIITPAVNGSRNYFANSRDFYSLGFNQEKTILDIWGSAWRPTGVTPAGPGISLQISGSQSGDSWDIRGKTLGGHVRTMRHIGLPAGVYFENNIAGNSRRILLIK